MLLLTNFLLVAGFTALACIYAMASVGLSLRAADRWGGKAFAAVWCILLVILPTLGVYVTAVMTDG